MAYEARRNNDDELSKEDQKKQSDATNAKVARTALEVADKVPLDPATAAIVKGVKLADDVTGGAVSKIAGKTMTTATKVMPGGKQAQKGLNKLNDSGAIDAAGKAVSMYDKVKGGKADSPQTEDTPKVEGEADKPNKPEVPKVEVPEDTKSDKPKDGGEQDSSLPSSGGSAAMKVGFFANPIFLFLMPTIILIILLMAIMGLAAGVFFDFEDAADIDNLQGNYTGELSFNTDDPEQQEFYNRVISVKNSYQSQGVSVDPLLVVSVFHSLRVYNANISYSDMTTARINAVVEAMYDVNENGVYIYDEQLFRENLRNTIIPSYYTSISEDMKTQIIEEVFSYISRYHEFIGTDNSYYGSCRDTGTCVYNINGFYINNGNISKPMNLNNLYVRLMQCGGNYGGVDGQPLEGEELVPFEKYILGVAYAEIGPNAPENAFKAQMIAARSYILARPTAAGGWRTITQEGDKWVIQAASCTADQVYCDPDRGCYASNGQSSQVHSGTGQGSYQRGPIDSSSRLRVYAAETQGEVLINSSNNIVYTPYINVDSDQFTLLANRGLDYKQIMIQVYSQKFPNAGVSGIYKASCGACNSSGDFAFWKQYEGDWTGVLVGTSGRTISQIGCLATSIAIQIERSGVQTNIAGDFNPGTFVEYLNTHGGFYGGNLNWSGPTAAAPSFVYQDTIYFDGYTRAEKLNKIREIVSQNGVYAVCEVKGNTGQHWVAIDSVVGDTINMMDPGSTATDMWSEYNWANTSRLVYYRVS